jgi:cobaltochelatase CobS
MAARIEALDADTRKRYDMIKRMSDGFSKYHATAVEMDGLLAEQLELEEAPVPAPKPLPPSPAASAGKPKPAPVSAKVPPKGADPAIEEVERNMASLVETIKSITSRGAKPGADDIANAVEDALRVRKVGIEDLDAPLRKRLESAPVVVRYELPSAAPVQFNAPDIPAFQQIVDDLVLGNNVFLVGGAGTGKTYLAENLLAKTALGRSHVTINCSQWTSPTEIIGGQTMDGYVEGKLIEAWSKGMVLVLDELPKIDPNTAGLLNDALAKTKVPNAVIFNSRKESFTKHKDFAVIATGNIYPDRESMAYGANNQQDLSLLDRFSGSVHFIEKNPALEKAILGNEMVWAICDRLRSAIQELRYEAQLSLRFMVNARDGYLLELGRLKGRPDTRQVDGKTLRSTFDSFLSTFTEIQRKNLKDRIKFQEILESYRYRTLEPGKSPYR